MRCFAASCVALLFACGGPTTPAAQRPKADGLGPSAAASAAMPLASSASSPAALSGSTNPPGERDSAEAQASNEEALFPGTEFPPADVPPPHERSAQSGDGQWQPLGSESRGDRLAGSPRVAVTTVLHPHPVSKWQRLTIAALDLEYARIGYMPGYEDVKGLEELGGTAPPDGFIAGLVPAAQQRSLLAVFNGGFKPRHGRWGMRVAGKTLLPAKEAGCTVTLDERGIAGVAPWKTFRAEEQLAAFRQTPPCLLSEGKLHRLLEQRNEKTWGGFDPKRKTRRRSAVGIDKSGRVLFYAIGEEMGPRVLAEGMRYAGAVNAAQLDINWSWTRFLLFGRSPDENAKASELRVTATLVPQMVHRSRGYVEKPAARDFFTVLKRLPN